MPDIFVSPPHTAATTRTSTPGTVPDSIARLAPQAGMLSAFNLMPEGIHFETQDANEVIILLLRRHWITNIPWIALSILLLVIPFLIVPFIAEGNIFVFSVPPSYITLLVFAWYLLTFSYFFSHFILWYFTVSIVTNERIVDIDYVNILHKKFAATKISRVEDVTMRALGFISSFFNFGNVEVQTAGNEPNFLFDAVPAPDRVVRIINQLMGQEEEDV